MKARAFLVFALAVCPLSLGAADVLDRLPFEVVMNVHWQGQDLEIRKVVSCDKRRRPYPTDRALFDLRPTEVWDQRVFRISHALPNGEILIVTLPPVCTPLQRSLRPPASTFLPRVSWLNDAKSPTLAEEIVTHRYYTENARRRFSMQRFEIREIFEDVKKFDDDQSLVWLLHSSVTPDAHFAGVNAAAFPREIWSRYPALADELRKLPETSLVERSFIERTARPILGVCRSEAQGIGPAERCLTGEFDDRPYAVSASQSADVWRIDYSDIGVKRFAHHIEAADVDRSGCNPSFVICNLYKASYRVQVNDKTFEFPRAGGRFIFDTDKQILLNIIFGIASSARKQ